MAFSHLNDIILRGWENFLARTSGPMHFRFLLQPAVACMLAIRAGLADAAAGRTPFLRSLGNPLTRHAQLVGALRELGTILIVATILDSAYQILVLRGIHLLELLFTVTVLAVLPYVLVRGPAGRIAGWLRKRKKKNSNNRRAA
ncbi:MAG TPA: hypothetical protein VIH99_10175 [Bdellovibrionota bacterium]|jgi:hypothetical protein